MTEEEKAAMEYSISASSRYCYEQAFLVGVRWERKQNKYKTLKELVVESLNKEKENMVETAKIGSNTAMFGMCSGAAEAYQHVLEYIKSLE